MPSQVSPMCLRLSPSLPSSSSSTYDPSLPNTDTNIIATGVVGTPTTTPIPEPMSTPAPALSQSTLEPIELPNEIILYILEFLRPLPEPGTCAYSYSPSTHPRTSYKNETNLFRDIKSCSLLSRQWRECAQGILFERWCLDIGFGIGIGHNSRGPFGDIETRSVGVGKIVEGAEGGAKNGGVGKDGDEDEGLGLGLGLGSEHIEAQALAENWQDRDSSCSRSCSCSRLRGSKSEGEKGFVTKIGGGDGHMPMPLESFLQTIGRRHVRFLKLCFTKTWTGSVKSDTGILDLRDRSVYPGFWKEGVDGLEGKREGDGDGEGYRSNGKRPSPLTFLRHLLDSNSNFNSENTTTDDNTIPNRLNLNLREILITPPGYQGRDLGEVLGELPGVVIDMVQGLGLELVPGMGPKPNHSSSSCGATSTGRVSRHISALAPSPHPPPETNTTKRTTTTKTVPLTLPLMLTLELPIMFYGMDHLKDWLKSYAYAERYLGIEEAWNELDGVLSLLAATQRRAQCYTSELEQLDNTVTQLDLVIGVRVKNILGVVESCERCWRQFECVDGDKRSGDSGENIIKGGKPRSGSGRSKLVCNVYPRHMEEGVLEEVKNMVEAWMPKLKDEKRLRFMCLKGDGFSGNQY